MRRSAHGMNQKYTSHKNRLTRSVGQLGRVLMRQRRKSLVCQHMERLSSATVETYSDMFQNIVGRRHSPIHIFRFEGLKRVM